MLINQGFADFLLIMIMKEGYAMNSEGLRQEMLKFLDENGMMKSIVAKQTGLSRSILSSWFSGRANLRESEMKVVQNYLDEKKKKFAWWLLSVIPRKGYYNTFVDCLLHRTIGIGGVWHRGKSRPWKAADASQLTVIFNVAVPNKFSMYRLVCVSKPYPTIMYPKTPQWDTDHNNIPCHAVFRRGCVARESNVPPQYIGRHPVTGEYITGCQSKCMILFQV